MWKNPPARARLPLCLNLLPDFHGAFIVGLEEVVGAVVLDRLSAILADIEDCNRAEEAEVRDKHCCSMRESASGWNWLERCSQNRAVKQFKKKKLIAINHD